MSNTFYPLQTDYIARLNELATANQLIDIETALGDVDAAVAAAAGSATAASGSATAAHTSELAAAASAASAAAIAGSFAGTSTSSLLIASGNKTFVTQTGEAYTAGIFMTAVSAANNANYMAGQVVSYSGTSLVLNVTVTGGSGTYADWNLSIAGVVGPQGPQGIPGSSLVNFTETVSSATPNATVRVAQLLANVSTTNGDLAVSPKGQGALLGNLPDNTTTGGNKRGIYAVDWQLSRSANDKVAAGNYSVVAGGVDNKASVTGDVVSGGSTNTASGGFSVVAGGQTNAASSSGATVSGGKANTASGTYSCVPGGLGATTRGVNGAYAWAGLGSHAVAGDSQVGQFQLSKFNTTNATPTILVTDSNAGVVAASQVTLPNNSAYYLKFRVLARNISSGAVSSGEGKLLMTRGASASTVALVGTPSFAWDFATSGFTLPVPAFTVDTTIGCLTVTVTGLASTTINWLCHVESVEITS